MQHEHHRPARPPLALFVAGAVVVSAPLLACIGFFWYRWVELSVEAPALALALRGTYFAAPLFALGLGGAIAWRRWATHEYIKAEHVTQLTRAQVSRFPEGLQSLSFHDSHKELPGPEVEALPAPIDVVQPLDAWMRWVDEQPHCLLGGRTKAGKTTAACAILARRLARRETVFIIDPHSSDWLGLPTAGRISREGELSRALGAVLNEYLRRMIIREQHKAATGRELPHTHFGRMTVLIDEANAIADMLPTQWETFAKQLASGARKVGIALLCLAQSPLVDDLKISSKMRSNFAALALDAETVRALIGRCDDKARKAALTDELIAIGDNYPAAAVIGAQVWLLDREGLDTVIEPADAHSLVWPGWDFAAGRAVEDAPRGQQTLVSAGALLPATIGGVRLAWLVAKMIDRGKAPGEIAPVLASLVLRLAPDADRAAVEQEIAQRAGRLAESGNAAAIAAQLDRDELIRMCVESGAGVNIAYAIYGGNRKDFLTRAKQFGTVVP